MAEHIYISKPDYQRLRTLVALHRDGRDGAAADRLDAELDRAIVVEPGEMPPDVVTLQSRVSYVEARTGALREVVLVEPAAADPSAGRVSVLAPVGAALVGLRQGDAIEWPLPDGRNAQYRILTVAQPEPAPAEAVA
ncbi:MAG TPA: nucleoside diphosphate kinase regulator [Myxococcales bacterium]|nr:nucleoside diphosphate kinase regulator [Myxococcales bacterium]